MSAGRYVVLALGRTEADLIAENEHPNLRAARGDAKRLIASDFKPHSVEITKIATGETIYVWTRSAARRGTAK